MLSLLIDQDFDHDILRGLLRRIPALDFITAHEAGLSAIADPELLQWAASNNRVLVTHDRSTMPLHARQLIKAQQDIAGIIIVPRNLSMAICIENLALIVTCTETEEWLNRIEYLPL